MRDITKHNKREKIPVWIGGVDDMILMMKRRARVDTDTELATFVGVSQSAISNWRRRHAVPGPARLAFERALDRQGNSEPERCLMARALAMRLPEFDYERMVEKGGYVDRLLVYGIHAAQLSIVVDECYYQLEIVESGIGLTPTQAAERLIASDQFYQQLSKWAASLSHKEVEDRQSREPMLVMGRHGKSHVEDAPSLSLRGSSNGSSLASKSARSAS